MTPDEQLNFFGLFAPAPGVHKSPPPTSDKGGRAFQPVDGSAASENPAPQPRATPPIAPASFALSETLLFVRSPRARHYRLTLKRDGTAVVTIPARGSEREARHFADEHATWLARARARQQKRPRTAATWGIGTQIHWRGETATIRIAPASTLERPAVILTSEERVRRGAAAFLPPDEAQPRQNKDYAAQIERDSIASGDLEIAAPFARTPIRVASFTADMRPTLEAHFLRLAKIELPARTWELATETRVPVTEVTVRNQRTRWGSCTTAGVISLNWRLVQAPPFVRDYIIYHELMHLREMNHSPRFWARVAEVCPYWQDAERWLKQNGSLLGL